LDVAGFDFSGKTAIGVKPRFAGSWQPVGVIWSVL
jgi:hypothetical protein